MPAFLEANIQSNTPITTKTSDSGAVSRTDERRLLDLIGHMYDASTDVEKWPIFLENVAEFFASKGAQIAHYDRGRNHHNFNFIHGFEFDRETLESIEHLIPDDPRFQYGLANAPKPIHCRMAVTTEELHATEIYKQLLGPAGIEYSAAVMLPLDDGLMTFLALFRTASDPVFTDEDCALLGELVPISSALLASSKNYPTAMCTIELHPICSTMCPSESLSSISTAPSTSSTKLRAIWAIQMEFVSMASASILDQRRRTQNFSKPSAPASRERRACQFVHQAR